MPKTYYGRRYHSDGKFRKEICEERALTRALNREWAAERLGGRCVKCGNTDRRVFHFDHIEPRDKRKSISALCVLKNRTQLKEELEKCQILCANCHMIKTLEDGSQGRRKSLIKEGEMVECSDLFEG